MSCVDVPAVRTEKEGRPSAAMTASAARPGSSYFGASAADRGSPGEPTPDSRSACLYRRCSHQRGPHTAAATAIAIKATVTTRVRRGVGSDTRLFAGGDPHFSDRLRQDDEIQLFSNDTSESFVREDVG